MRIGPSRIFLLGVLRVDSGGGPVGTASRKDPLACAVAPDNETLLAGTAGEFDLALITKAN